MPVDPQPVWQGAPGVSTVGPQAASTDMHGSVQTQEALMQSLAGITATWLICLPVKAQHQGRQHQGDPCRDVRWEPERTTLDV